MVVFIFEFFFEPGICASTHRLLRRTLVLLIVNGQIQRLVN